MISICTSELSVESVGLRFDEACSNDPEMNKDDEARLYCTAFPSVKRAPSRAKSIDSGCDIVDRELQQKIETPGFQVHLSSTAWPS